MSTYIYSKEEKQEMLRLARETIKGCLEKKQRKIDEKSIPDYLLKERSCFVTLHTTDGNLRGCIGNIVAFESLYENIKHNAINAAFHDPRFSPVKGLNELNTLHIEISVLTPITKINSYKDIILGRQGIVLKHRGAGAVFLPQVATEQNWDLPTTLSHLSMKAGLPPNAWQNQETKFEVFEAIVFSEYTKTD